MTELEQAQAQVKELDQIASNLQQRIGQLVSQYETQLAVVASRLQAAQQQIESLTADKTDTDAD